MIVWEWRRVYRQWLRNAFPVKNISYKDATRKKLILGFAFFFVGWKLFGFMIQDKILFRWDEASGEMRYFDVPEAKELVKKELLQQEKESYKKPSVADPSFVTSTIFNLDSD
uniref:Uncharacterized protein n=1 Tax=Rhabditophanes sp. KR3021 TaxID=114890 RepID=A0AC35U3B1_9BILA